MTAQALDDAGRPSWSRDAFGTEYVLPLLIRERARTTPDRLFLSDVRGPQLTYAGAHDGALRWAAAFQRVGVKPGDLVATMLPNSAKAFLIWQGLAWLRATEVPIHDLYRGDVLAHVLHTTRPRIVLIASEYLDRLIEIQDEISGLELVVILGSDETAAPKPVDAATKSENEFLSGTDTERLELDDPGPHDIAAVLFTSGTTGPSKGVLVPWPQLYAAGMGTIPVDRLTEADVIYEAGTIAHIGAKCLPFVAAVIGGAVVVRTVFSRTEFWNDVDKFGVTATAFVSTIATFLMNEAPSPDDLRHSLRHVVMSPVIEDVDAFNARFGTRTRTVYNMTETAVPISSDGYSLEDGTAVGRARDGFPWSEIRLVDQDDYDVPVGAVGEVIVRTSIPWTMNAGYVNNPVETARSWRNGWFHTGDLMRRDADGRYFFAGRAKDSVRRRGENVSCYEVEAAISRHADVAECAVFGVPADDTQEEELMAVVVAKPGSPAAPADIVEFLAPTLPKFMVPRFVRFVDALPRTSVTQRVQKGELRLIGRTPDTWERASTLVPRR